jgi:hypothetical protein
VSIPLSLTVDRQRQVASSPLSLTVDSKRRGAAPSSSRLSPLSLTQIQAGTPVGPQSLAAETVGRRLLVLPMRCVRMAPAHLRRVLPRRNIDKAQPAMAQVLPDGGPSLSGIAPLLTLSLSLYRRRHDTQRGGGGDGNGARGSEKARGHGAR